MRRRTVSEGSVKGELTLREAWELSYESRCPENIVKVRLRML